MDIEWKEDRKRERREREKKKKRERETHTQMDRESKGRRYNLFPRNPTDVYKTYLIIRSLFNFVRLYQIKKIPVSYLVKSVKI